jgi:hypothetical protein
VHGHRRDVVLRHQHAHLLAPTRGRTSPGMPTRRGADGVPVPPTTTSARPLRVVYWWAARAQEVL